MEELQPTSLQFYEDKYRLKDQFGNNVDDDINSTFIRIAASLSNVELTQSKKEKYYAEFYWALKNGALPAGRIISNAGAEEFKPNTSLINCVVSGNIHDSLDDILLKLQEAGLTLRAGCGIGFNFSTLRPKGAIVSGAGAKTSGTLSFAEIFDKMCQTIVSAGERRGAMMMTIDVRHPDIFDAIKVKREAGKLKHFNISILITDSFIKAVKNNENWDLIFPASKYDFKENCKIIYDYWPINDDKTYVINKENKVACKVYQTVKAKKIWDLIMENTYNFADPGFLLIDRINKYNNLWFCEKINSTNPCITEDNWINTTKGSKQVKDLINKKFVTKINISEYKTISNGFFETGTSDVYLVETEKGYSIKCTFNHPFYKLLNSQQIEKVKLNGLKINDRVLLNKKTNNKWNNKIGNLEYGKLLSLFFIENNIIANRKFVEKNIIIKIEKSSYETYLGFLSSIFDSKACYIKTNNAAIILNISNLKLCQTIQRMLFNLGIICSTHKSEDNSHKLIISKVSNIKMFQDIIPISNQNKIKQLTLIFKNKKIRFDKYFSDTISSIKYIGKEKVYNTTIESVHRYEANCFLVGNCGEQPLPEFNSCLLGSINLTKLVNDPFTDNAKFCFQRYTKLVQIFTRMLDNVVEINNLPLKQQRLELKRKRRHGMGILGLGSCLSMLKISYGSVKSLELSNKIMKILALENYRIGALLAKEKGEAPVLKENFILNQENTRYHLNAKIKLDKKYKGRELFLMSHYFDNWENDLDAKIVYKLLQTNGCRFSHATSIAPTGTISISFGNNVSNGIEPSYEHSYSRNVIVQGRKTKKKINILSYEYLQYIKYEYNLTTLEEVFNELENNKNIKIPVYLKTTNDISIDDHINMVSICQKWIDSSISKTINVPTDISFEDFKNVYLIGHSKGLKGITSYRYAPENTSGVLITDKDLKATTYKIILENGEELLLSGDEEVNYENEISSINNLYDAFKHNTYGTY